MRVLVTGGAGYIGAHVVRLLQNRGDDIVVVDDLSTGERRRVPPDVPLVRLDVSASDARASLGVALREYGVEAVIHFAAKKQVGESVARPLWYYEQNVGGLMNLLSAMETSGVDRLVFSSSAAAYGSPPSGVGREDGPATPINPYGETKLIGEWLCRDASAAWGLRALSLRYFNVAGAGWPELGDPWALNLIPIAIGHVQARTPVPVFGDDYETRDGTCVRDYVHVLDLADAHLAALDYTGQAELPVDILNVGTGSGATVLEVLEALREASGEQVSRVVTGRRPGDPALLTADVSRISQHLGWRARYGLMDIMESAWEAAVRSRGS